MLKVNSTKDIEPITIRIDKVHTPIAFATKVEELVEDGMERAEAEKMADKMEHGVLKIELPKKEVKKEVPSTRNIEIR